ncbi:MAG: putative inner membrane protein [Deltaproteobacteria bacterium ADurb.Bin510]|nr:MAG: putative inner membrane protein [Deltaproteobacteria bacterium ADurb.Bin510]
MSEYFRQRGGTIGFVVAIVLTAIAFFWMIRPFMVYIVVAAALATLFYPLHLRFVRRFKGREGLSALMCCLVLVLCILGPVYAIGQMVTLQALELHQSAVPVVQRLMEQDNARILEQINDTRLGQYIDVRRVDWGATAKEVLGAGAKAASTVLNKTATSVISFVTGFFIVIFTLFYFFRDGQRIVARLKYLSPLNENHENRLIEQFVLISRATVKGTIVIGLIQGSLGALTLLCFGVKSWLVWGVVMVVLSIIPMIGPWLVLIPAGLIHIALGSVWQGVVIILISVVVVSNVDNLVRPVLVGRDAKLHDLMIFFSTLGGLMLFGVLGFIVGPVIAAFLVAMLDIYGNEYREHLDREEAGGA